MMRGMAINVQQRGSRFQLRVTHRNLPKPFFFTFDTHVEAQDYGDRLHALLEQGFVPQELLAPSRGENPLVGDIISQYIDTAPGVTASDRDLLRSMMPYVIVRLGALTYRWCEEWVDDLKVRRRIAPSSIRKRVGALARVIDWHLRMTNSDRSNPLRMLPRGYSNYDHRHKVIKTDVQRDRRLKDGEEEKILSVLSGEMLILFRLITHTGLRLREAYKLRADQFDLVHWVIKVEGTKGTRGTLKPRVVPIVPDLREMLIEHLKGRVGRIFGFWNGDPDDLDNCTARLSNSFRHYFDRVGIHDLREHDLRHEATCRWLTMRDAEGRWMFSDIEVARIMGWSSMRMMLRYASLRGEDLSARLG